jgi:hypothetical protein
MDLQRLTQQQAAVLLDVTPRTLRDWEKSGLGIPRNEDGTYSGPQLVKWEKTRDRAEADELDPVQELARKNKALADKTELENAQTRGEVGLISEVADRLGGHIDRACARLEQIPDALGQFCDARTAALIVPECKRLIREARAELAVDMASLGGHAGREMGSGAGSNSQSVGGRESPAVERKQRRARAVAN